jgi:hypothetical protein
MKCYVEMSWGGIKDMFEYIIQWDNKILSQSI